MYCTVSTATQLLAITWVPSNSCFSLCSVRLGYHLVYITGTSPNIFTINSSMEQYLKHNQHVRRMERALNEMYRKLRNSVTKQSDRPAWLVLLVIVFFSGWIEKINSAIHEFKSLNLSKEHNRTKLENDACFSLSPSSSLSLVPPTFLFLSRKDILPLAYFTAMHPYTPRSVTRHTCKLTSNNTNQTHTRTSASTPRPVPDAN